MINEENAVKSVVFVVALATIGFVVWAEGGRANVPERNDIAGWSRWVVDEVGNDIRDELRAFMDDDEDDRRYECKREDRIFTNPPGYSVYTANAPVLWWVVYSRTGGRISGHDYWIIGDSGVLVKDNQLSGTADFIYAVFEYEEPEGEVCQ